MELVLPVVILVLAFEAFLARIFHSMDQHTKVRKGLGMAILAAYACIDVRLTLLGRAVITTKPAYLLEPFWSYREALSLNGFVLQVEDPSLAAEIILNYLFYMPLGALLPFTWPNRFGCASWKTAADVAFIALCCSLVTESIQLLFRIGYFELDDLFGNVAGAVLGFFLYRFLLSQKGE